MKIFRFISFHFVLNAIYNIVELTSILKANFHKKGFTIDEDTNEGVFRYTTDKLLFIHFKGEFILDYSEGGIKINIKLYTENIFKVIVVVLLVGAFFSSFTFKAFLIFSIVFSILFYLFIFLLVKSQFYRVLESFIEQDDEKGIMTEEQKRWLNDVNTCSACGSAITKYHIECPECGLKIREKQNYSRFSTTNNSLHLKYKYKEE